jgi:hypothetical protein
LRLLCVSFCFQGSHFAQAAQVSRGLGERDDEVGVVVVWAQIMSAEVDDLMPRRAELGD